MYHLDQVGRLEPSTLDVSRAAARRHELASALRESRFPAPGAPPARPRPRWLRVVACWLRGARVA